MTASAESLKRLEAWVDRANTHFVRTKGEIYGDADAWNDIYHDPEISNELVWDWLDIMETVRLQEPDVVTRRAEDIFKEAQKYIHVNGHKPRCFDKGLGKHKHQPLFKTFMEMRDLINRMKGWEMPKPQRVEIDPNPTQFERLFEIGA